MRAWLWTGCGLLAWAAGAGLGCGDDDDGQLERPVFDASRPPDRDAGPLDAGPLDAGEALDELGLDRDRLVSDLTPEEGQVLCKKLDEVTGLLGDLEQACTVEAYLITYDAKDCSSIVKQCKNNEATVLGLELELPCAKKPLALAGCDAPINDVLACAVQLGDFWAERVCETEALADPGPLCPQVVGRDCPLLFGGGE